MKKELSHYGAIRCTLEEVHTAMSDTHLNNFYAEIAQGTNGKNYCRAFMDPTSQIYASWYLTIAGAKGSEIWSNHRGRLGDMVETALGFLKLVDEYIGTLGWLVGDPNSMTNRIEQFIRHFLDMD